MRCTAFPGTAAPRTALPAHRRMRESDRGRGEWHECAYGASRLQRVVGAGAVSARSMGFPIVKASLVSVQGSMAVQLLSFLGS